MPENRFLSCEPAKDYPSGRSPLRSAFWDLCVLDMSKNGVENSSYVTSGYNLSQICSCAPRSAFCRSLGTLEKQVIFNVNPMWILNYVPKVVYTAPRRGYTPSGVPSLVTPLMHTVVRRACLAQKCHRRQDLQPSLPRCPTVSSANDFAEALLSR